MCGEKLSTSEDNLICDGSPPRVRGEGPDRFYQAGPVRITPACAGRSGVLRYNVTDVKDHPRVCGEKRGKQILERGGRGSPPRVRGEVVRNHLEPHGTRITPACAGRSCTRSAPGSGCSGSPPRVRGEVASSISVATRKGITPACAGRSCFSVAAKSTTTDHPRVRGEKRPSGVTVTCSEGSPPRARGEVGCDVCKRDLRRITPACAGRSWPRSRGRARSWDHPRVRGEKLIVV